MMRRWALAIVLLASACAAPGSPPSPTAAPAAKPTEAAKPAATTAAAKPAASQGGTTNARMNTFGTCGEPWNWWAQEKGIYTKYGLNMEQVRGTGGGASIAAVMSNAVEFGYVNPLTAITAFNQGFPILYVANAAVAAFPPLPPAQGVWVKTDSPIKTAADLRGKKVGVNEVGGINQIVTSAWLKKAGVDPTDVRFVALPFAQLVPAVMGGTLEAAQTPYTYAAASRDQVRTIADPFVDSGTRIMIAGYVAHRDYVAQNPKVVENFNLAIKEAIQQVNEPANRDAVFDIVAAGCKGDAQVLKNTPDNAMDPVVNMTTMQEMAQFMVDQGLLARIPELNQLVPEFARK